MEKHILKDGVYWVGAIDFNLRSFHHYSEAQRGTTYNAFFIDDEKKVLVDTVSEEFTQEFIQRLSEYIEPEKIDYIICHHLERDHSGALARMVELCKPEIIYCSKLGLTSMKGQFDTTGWNIQVVKDGETINIGKRNITFYETRMLHWPDSMCSYIHEDKILFTHDAFGQNIATSLRFAECVDRNVLYEELKYYYANIVLPFSSQVLKTLDKLASLNLDIDIMAPDHGLMYRRKEDIEFVLQCYDEFAKQPFKKSAVILHDSMWGATEKMASIIGETLFEEGIPYTVMDIQKNHPADIMNALMDASILLVGAATRNNLPMTGMMATLTHIKGLRPLNKCGAAFGSYGWSGEAPEILTKWLEEMNIKIISEPLRIQYGLNPQQIIECQEFAKKIAASIDS